MKKLFTSVFKSSASRKQFRKYIVVPDLHGTYSVYQKVEHYLKNETDKDTAVIFLGDYMDRGESGVIDGKEFQDAGSYFTIRDILALQRWAEDEEREYIFLRGNHEIFYENFFIDGSINAYKQYPFFRAATEALEYVMRQDSVFSDQFIAFLKALRPYYLDKKNGYLFVHAGIDPESKDLERQVKKGTVYWIRDKFILSKKRLPYKVVFGHTPFFEPFVKKDKIGLDCGIYRTGYINLLKIDGKKYEIFKL